MRLRERAENLNERDAQAREPSTTTDGNSIFESGGSPDRFADFIFVCKQRDHNSVSTRASRSGNRASPSGLHSGGRKRRLSSACRFEIPSLSKKKRLTFIVTVSSLLAHLSILAMLLRLMPIERFRSQR